jgi:hypothetical protein
VPELNFLEAYNNVLWPIKVWEFLLAREESKNSLKYVKNSDKAKEKRASELPVLDCELNNKFTLFWLGVLHPRLWIEETKELDVYETEFSWNLKGLVAIAIAIAVRKKSLAAAEPAIQFSETPPRRERALDRCSRIETPPPALCSVPEFIEKMNWINCLEIWSLDLWKERV